MTIVCEVVMTLAHAATILGVDIQACSVIDSITEHASACDIDMLGEMTRDYHKI